ncbi:MAG: 4Fe-4S binding protein [Desulfobacteraceae bacterium]|jgi:2-oxoglutarate ferredoxin oxidoreductase subunit delta
MSPKLWREPLDQEEKAPPTGTIHLIEERCKGCALCVEYCPCGVLEMSDAFNRKGYHTPLVVEPSACVACEFCEEVCPEFAIYCTVEQDQGLRPG